MLVKGGVALVVEVVDQPGDPPVFHILAEFFGIVAHRTLDGQHVLAQAVALHPLRDERPGFVAGGCMGRDCVSGRGRVGHQCTAGRSPPAPFVCGSLSTTSYDRRASGVCTRLPSWLIETT